MVTGEDERIWDSHHVLRCLDVYVVHHFFVPTACVHSLSFSMTRRQEYAHVLYLLIAASLISTKLLLTAAVFMISVQSSLLLLQQRTELANGLGLSSQCFRFNTERRKFLPQFAETKR